MNNENTETKETLDKKVNSPKKNNVSPSKSSKVLPQKNNIKEQFYQEIFSELIQKKITLQNEIAELEKKQITINKKIEESFSGQSENIVKHVKGFQEYLSGAFQNLSQSVQKLELVSQPIVVKPSPLDKTIQSPSKTEITNIPALLDPRG